MQTLLDHLIFLYGPQQAPRINQRAQGLIDRYRAKIAAQSGELTERDSILITYGDQVHSPHELPLKTLTFFCETHLKDLIGGIHILPFYPSTSDDGFSVTDYRSVDPALGSWDDLARLGTHFRLMFDAVINHVSAQSAWFQAFLRGDAACRDYFICVDAGADLSQVVRPRTLPLLTPFPSASGEKQIWTTFSADQVDLNYHNPEVLLEILEVLLVYSQRGATWIRLDAIAYLWKQIGTACIHLPQTHHVIQFFRAALDGAAAHVQLITETNVPHADNISYFGDGTHEAQLVYNFALPPLVLHAFHNASTRELSAWAAGLAPPSSQTTFFNFLASHDGIGLGPARGILAEAHIDALVQKTLEHGGAVSYKNNADGSQSAYEMNINYFDALSDPHAAEPLQIQVRRFMAAQAILLALVGLPGIYFHSLLGSRGWILGPVQTGRSRTINREKLALAELEDDLGRPASLRAEVFGAYRQLLAARRACAAFHPHGTQAVLDVHPSVFALERIAPDRNSRAMCFASLSAEAVTFNTTCSAGRDLISGKRLPAATVTLEPYQILWIRP